MASIVDAALRIKNDPSMLIDPEVVHRACEAANHDWRDRVLDPLHTIEAFALQIAHGNTAIADLVRLSPREFSESAYCQARGRLPVGVFRAMLSEATARLIAAARGIDTDFKDGPKAPDAASVAKAAENQWATGTWKGHRTLIADGTGIDMPDTPDLQTHFGQPVNQKPGCGFPVAHGLPLFDAHSGLVLDMIVSPFETHDLTKMPLLHPHLKKDDILLADRIFGAYTHIAMLRALEVHGLFRAHHGRTIPYPASTEAREKYPYNRHRRQTPILVEVLGVQDQVVELVKPHIRSPWLSAEQFAQIPATMRVRVLKFKVQEKGFRSREIELMTTLLDAKRYPAADLAELYLARWRVEVNFRHLKRTLGMTTLRCKTVEGVTKELLMYALVYNAVCVVMMAASRKQGVCVRRISFVDALRWMRYRREDEELPGLKVNPKRKGRVYQRVTKRGMKHLKMTIPRDLWKQQVLAPEAN